MSAKRVVLGVLLFLLLAYAVLVLFGIPVFESTGVSVD